MGAGLAARFHVLSCPHILLIGSPGLSPCPLSVPKAVPMSFGCPLDVPVSPQCPQGSPHIPSLFPCPLGGVPRAVPMS